MARIRPKSPRRCTSLDACSPFEIAERLRHLEGLVFFDTAGHLPGSARVPISVIAAKPSRIHRGSIHHPADRQRLRQALAAMPETSIDQGFPLGGLAGWTSYEGEFVFGEYPEMLVFDHQHQQWWETGDLSECFADNDSSPVEWEEFQPLSTRSQFLAAVERIQEWIRSGDIYQVNLAQTFEAGIRGGSLFGLYQHLRDASPAPMAAWMALDGCEVLSSSPESFLRISGRQVETRPIKGTRPRFADPDEDLRSAYELQTSPKEIAELVMITDLLRNDLGQVCEFGSVDVAEMLQLESLEQVHHLVSTIHGTLNQDQDAIDCLAACFPGGSITGAPKKRAMEIIREVEGEPRGIYCGAIGWLGRNAESSFNIAIRTLVREGDTLSYRVGAGIVADSVPEHEYHETLHKAAGIRLAIERWESGT